MESQMKAVIGITTRKGPKTRNVAQYYSLLIAILFCQVASQTDPEDVAVLMVLQQNWGYNNPELSSWKGVDPCHLQEPWLGVSCNGTSYVEALALPNMKLVGTLPIAIGNLKHLKRLDLSFNANLTGTLPRELGNLDNLQSLVLQWCGFSGPIPSELGRLSNLTFLALNGNYLSGPIPHELGLLTRVYYFDVSSNQLSGELPVSAKFGSGLDNLIMAKHLHLNNNSFEGSIPGSIFHAEMEVLHLLLDANNLTGPIPVELGSLRKITIIKLNNNNLSGKIPDIIENITTLTDLELHRNTLSDMPSDLSRLKKLKVLDLSHNIFSAMNVPPWISNMSSLNSLFMSNTNLHGQIPSSVLSLPQLRILNLSNNFINGTLAFPINISQRLEYMYLDYNNITDIIQLASYNLSNVLELQGNPVCSILAPSYCHMSLPPEPVVSPSFCPLISCSFPRIFNPNLCVCAVPYVGVYIFRAPQSRALDNNTEFYNLTSAIDLSLGIGMERIVMAKAFFDNFQYLNIFYHFFPSKGSERFTKEEVYNISYKLSSGDLADAPVYPAAIFGPSQFRPLPYPFLEEVNTMLSRSAEIGIIAAAVALGIIIVAVCVYLIWQKRKHGIFVPGEAPQLKVPQYFSFSELKKATENFSNDNYIGTGSYGKVYKGTIDSGGKVAIKRAHENSIRGEADFKTEIKLLSRVHHTNLVDLVGFCYEQGEKILVYEYMEKGNLRENIPGMDWERRIMAALGAARGLHYLHEMANPPIVHTDIKSTNILLNENNVAKIADIGTSKVLQSQGEPDVSTHVRATMGYMAPEYFLNNQLTEKSDVYSFGVVLFEILTAREPYEKGKHIVPKVQKALTNGKILALLDPTLKDFPPKEFHQFLDLALRCVKGEAENRPTMSEVVKELEDLAGMNQNLGSSKPESEHTVRHPYSSDSDIMQSTDKMDSSFFYTGAYMVPTTIEPK